MKLAALILAAVIASAASAFAAPPTSQPIHPGPPFWNAHALRFIYAPAFDLPKVHGAKSYRFTISSKNGPNPTFTAPQPTAALSPIWDQIDEGYTTLTVQALDSSDKPFGPTTTKIFYRSPGFTGQVSAPPIPYQDAGRAALRAIFQAPHVQHWLADAKPDRSYARYCYPNKIIGGLLRAMCAYARIAENDQEKSDATTIARRSADYLLSLRLPDSSPYAHLPPTYALNVDRPTNVTPQRVNEHWLLVPSAIDAAFGFLDAFDLTHDSHYFDAAQLIADTFVKTQGADGTWPLMVNDQTGKPIVDQRLIPTWVIYFFDRLHNQYHIDQSTGARDRAWAWIVNNPLKTYQWDAQFEDIQLREPYVNLAREQACDVADLLLSSPNPSQKEIAQAEELLRFAEDQFVVWSPLRDVQGWKKAMPNRRKNCEAWITPCVLEQYACYDPVARSSAILINVYIKAHQVTRNPIYLAKARALANGLLAGQAWLAQTHNGNGEIPTWNMKRRPINWLNNSYYAAQSILHLADYERAPLASP